MTRFRDTITGLFTKSRDKLGTVAESGKAAAEVRALRRQRMDDEIVLRHALNQSHEMAHPYQSARVLQDAIEKVLRREP